MEPGETETKQMSAADVQHLGSGDGAEISSVEGFEGLSEEFRSEALSELVLLFSRPSEPRRAAGARHFVGLRYAPASSMPGPGGGVSF